MRKTHNGFKHRAGSYTSQNRRQLPSPKGRMAACPLRPAAAAGRSAVNVPGGRQAVGTSAKQRHSGQCTTLRSGLWLYLQLEGAHGMGQA